MKVLKELEGDADAAIAVLRAGIAILIRYGKNASMVAVAYNPEKELVLVHMTRGVTALPSRWFNKEDVTAHATTYAAVSDYASMLGQGFAPADEDVENTALDAALNPDAAVPPPHKPTRIGELLSKMVSGSRVWTDGPVCATEAEQGPQ